MRYLFILLSLFCFLFISFSGQAKPKNNIIKLYTKPSTRASVVTKINPLKNLVPIYQKGAWVKVGDPENGDVGWININEYQSAVRKLTGTQEKTQNPIFYSHQRYNAQIFIKPRINNQRAKRR